MGYAVTLCGYNNNSPTIAEANKLGKESNSNSLVYPKWWHISTRMYTIRARVIQKGRQTFKKKRKLLYRRENALLDRRAKHFFKKREKQKCFGWPNYPPRSDGSTCGGISTQRLRPAVLVISAIQVIFWLAVFGMPSLLFFNSILRACNGCWGHSTHRL